MARTDGRVELGKNPEQKLKNAKSIAEKHHELGAKSPLKVLEDVDWALVQPKVEAALQAHEQAEDYKMKMEQAYRERDSAMPEIEKALKKSVNLLKASFGDNPKKLGTWGIQVDDSVKPKTPKDAKGE